MSTKIRVFLAYHHVCVRVTALVAASIASSYIHPALAVPGFPNSVQPINGRQNEKDQCAGTLRRYNFPAIGYQAKKKSKSSREGQLLYKQLDCMQCHSISGFGGDLGPALDGIGAYRGKTWLIAHLSDPDRVYRSFPTILRERSNIMPHPGLTNLQAEQISDYLLTLAEPKGGFSVTHHKVENVPHVHSKDWTPNKPSTASRRGKELFFGLGCAACHSLDGAKDRFGPDLAGLGARLSAHDLQKVLKGVVSSQVMKGQADGLSLQEREDIQSFLLTVPKPIK